MKDYPLMAKSFFVDLLDKLVDSQAFRQSRIFLSTLFRKFGDLCDVTASGGRVGPASLPAVDQ